MIQFKEKIMRFGSRELSVEEVINDYRIAFRSRQASLIGRREVMGGKAKFGIFGGGKEVAQMALARAFRRGDFRSGYYRDQTMMFALDVSSLDEFFAQLYAHADIVADPATGGRQMNCHYSSRSLNDDGSWQRLSDMPNTSPDGSPTASQMPRLVGLAYASRLYRELEELKHLTEFSSNGDEIAWGTIGNASCAEGMFWESVNAIGVLRSPAVISIWDDEYGISVPNEFQITKNDLSELLHGFQRKNRGKSGFDLYQVKGWDYAEMVGVYQKAAHIARKEHVPAIVHVVELTQPQGHSTSGSHERYKSKRRLAWEREYDCLKKMREWIISSGFLDKETLNDLERDDAQMVEEARDRVWERYLDPIRKEVRDVCTVFEKMAGSSRAGAQLQNIASQLAALQAPLRRDIHMSIHDALIASRFDIADSRAPLLEWKSRSTRENLQRYGAHLYSETAGSPLNVLETPARYSDDSPSKMGFEILNACFDKALSRDPRLIAFGEDVGKLGDVNQGFKGLQDKYGEFRVSDTGIRECTIIGQAIGLALRGLRPIAEIQYLDYILYAIQIMSDDLATIRWRSAGGQKAPVIVRTRGHRLEGVWHAGSPLAGMLHLLRGMHILVPRNMTQAAGFYNTLLRSDDPAVVVEVLNAYRKRELLPDNIEEFTLPLGQTELLLPGTDITLVTYGACVSIAMEAVESLAQLNISAELIDVQSLMPFDLSGDIVESLKKTNRVIFIDEDVPGGTTAYMMQEVLEAQDGYKWLDAEPVTISAKAHRPAYGSDGDYWSKPNREEIVERAYRIMHESNPARYPLIF